MTDSQDVWYFAKGDKRFGPFRLDELEQRIATGEVDGNDLVWHAGDADWRRAADVAELGLGGRSAAVPVPPPPSNAPWPAPAEASRPVLASSEDVPNYLWQSIVVTIICCWATGIPAIVYATQVDRKLGQGDVAGARRSSQSAKNWCIVSLFGPILVAIAWFVVAVGFSVR